MISKKTCAIIALASVGAFFFYDGAITPDSAAAQSVKEKREHFQQRLKAKRARVKTRRENFSKEIEQRQQNFSALIQQRWKDFTLKAAAPNPYRIKPKPEIIAPARKTKEEQPPPLSKLKPITPQTAPPAIPKPSLSESFTITINVWGNIAELAIPNNFKTRRAPHDQLSAEAIRLHFQQAIKDMPPIILQADRIKRQLALNDWGYVLLLHKIARAIFPRRQSARMLFVWQAAHAAGLAARLALSAGRPILLIASKQIIFETPRLVMNAKTYYAITLPREISGEIGRRLKTYPAARQENAARKIDLHITRPPRLFDRSPSQANDLHFTFGQRRYDISVPINRAMLSYLKDFPLADFKLFVDAPLATETAAALKKQFAPLRQETPERAVNFLLAFVQKSFRYENDQDRIGREDYLFGEETLNAASSDCEDRVALFAWLSTHVLGLKTVAVYWRGHLAAAVELDGAQGLGLRYRGRRFIYADPTFVNAPIGRVVPPYENQQPEKIIPIGF